MLDVELRDACWPFGVYFDEVPEAIFVAESLSVDARWIAVNAAGCEMLGYAREEIVGTRIVDTCPPDARAQMLADIQAMRASGFTLAKEGALRHKDGSFLSVEIRAKALADGRCYAFMREISARKTAERERDTALRWCNAVLEQSPIGLALTRSPRFEQLEFNARAEQMLGRPWGSDAELQGRLHTLDGEPSDPDRLPLVEALRGKRIVAAEYLAADADGGLTPIGLSAGPIVGPDGEVLGAVAAFEDISAPKELERLRAEWSSVVAHDLRQPLGSIAFNAQLLARSTDDPKLGRYVERIRAASARLSRMVGDLMDLSRLDASRLELVRRPVDVPALARGCVEQAALQVPDRPFDVHVRGEVPEVDADPDRIAQVMENLLTNAIKYGSPGSKIAVTVEPEDAKVAVSVANEGRTLQAEELEHLFERFQRAESAKSAGLPGVGLGLYITRALVEAHGGRISVRSTAEGVTTFRFTLPGAGPTPEPA